VAREPYKHSPAGLFTAIRQFSSEAYKGGKFLDKERAFHGDLSKAILGTSAMYLGWKYGKNRYFRVTGGPGETSATTRTLEQTGWSRMSIQVPTTVDGVEGYWSLPIERVSPVLNQVAIGAWIQEANERGDLGEEIAEKLMQAAWKGVRGEAEVIRPYTDQISHLFQLFEGGADSKNMKKWLGDMGATYHPLNPGVKGQFRNAFSDPIVRDPQFEEATNSPVDWINRSKGLKGSRSEEMAPRTDLFGKPMSRSPSGKFVDKAMTFMWPGTGAGFRPKDERAEELLRLGITLDVPNTELKEPIENQVRTDEKGTEFLRAKQDRIPLTASEKTLVKMVKGQAREKAVEKAMSLDSYAGSDIERQRKLVQYLMSVYNDQVQKKVRNAIELAHAKGRQLVFEDLDLSDLYSDEEELRKMSGTSGIDIFSGNVK
jgi:hypothetical protein